jgi:hypothetical protein
MLKMLAATTPAVRDFAVAHTTEIGRTLLRRPCRPAPTRRDRRLAQLVAICDLHTWEVQIGLGLSRRATSAAMLTPLIAEGVRIYPSRRSDVYASRIAHTCRKSVPQHPPAVRRQASDHAVQW